MTIQMLQIVMEQGDNRGSALRSLLKFYHIEDNDLSPITDDMARTWLKRQKCKVEGRDVVNKCLERIR